MVHTYIWLAILGVALLLPNVLAIRFAFGAGGGGAAVATGAAAPAAAAVAATGAPPARAARRALVGRPSPGFVRRGYLWKALSPMIFGLLFVLGLAIGGVPGYVIIGLGLVNLLFGFWGWDAYIPGKMGKR